MSDSVLFFSDCKTSPVELARVCDLFRDTFERVREFVPGELVSPRPSPRVLSVDRCRLCLFGDPRVEVNINEPGCGVGPASSLSSSSWLSSGSSRVGENTGPPKERCGCIEIRTQFCRLWPLRVPCAAFRADVLDGPSPASKELSFLAELVLFFSVASLGLEMAFKMAGSTR